MARGRNKNSFKCKTPVSPNFKIMSSTDYLGFSTSLEPSALPSSCKRLTMAIVVHEAKFKRACFFLQILLTALNSYADCSGQSFSARYWTFKVSKNK